MNVNQAKRLDWANFLLMQIEKDEKADFDFKVESAFANLINTNVENYMRTTFRITPLTIDPTHTGVRAIKQH